MNSTFPPEEVKKEHGVVYKEIELNIDNPDSVLWDVFARLVYQVHPYRVPVLGYPERFKEVTRDDVFAYYKRRYAPQRTTFLVVGDVDATEALNLMAKTVAGWKRTNVDETAVPEEPEQVAPREVTVRHNLCQVPKVMLGFPSVSMRHPDLYALDVLASILGDGRSSRLYRTVKDEKQLALEISAWNYTPQYKGTFAVSITTEEEKIPEARKAALDVLKQIEALPPTKEELDRAKRKVQANHVFSQMTAEGVAEALGSDWFVSGDLDFSQTYVDEIGKVTAEDVIRVAKKYLDLDKLNVAVMLPGKAAEKGPEKAQEKKPAALTADRAWLQSPAGQSVEQADVKEFAGALTWEIKLKSGLRVVVREDKSLPAVNVSFSVLGGQRWEPENLPGAANLLSEMLDHGTKSRTKLQIAGEIESLGASLTTFGGRNTYGLSLRCLKDDLPKVFEIGADCLLNSVFPEDELKKVKEEVLAAIAQEDEDLFSINNKVFRPLLFGKHPYGRPVRGTKESVEKITREDLAGLCYSSMLPNYYAIAFVGDISPAEAMKLVDGYASNISPYRFKVLTETLVNVLNEEIKKHPFKPPEHSLEPLPPEQKAEKTKAGIEGAILTLGFRGVNLKNADRETLDLLGAVLSGLGGRLSIVVREHLGAAYSVGAYNDSQLDGGAFVFYVQTDAQHVPKLTEVFWTEIKKLHEETVAEKELASIKSYLSGTEAIALQDQSDLAQRLALCQLYEEGAASVFKRFEKYEKITAAQVQEAAKKYLDPKAWVLTVLKPAEEKKEPEK
ncbi:MAG: insulinase family protein [Planctomycetes bacterium]|nr:insulinase family protein [Planctomycetota bacterium]